MKTLFLLTSSNEVLKYSETLANLKWGDVTHITYDIPGTSDHGLYAAVKAQAPDLIVYVGSRWGLQPAITTLCKITNSIAPMIHLCSDAADMPWYDLLRDYHMKGAFTLQVAIDGSKNWPCSGVNMTALTPVDPLHFPSEIPHHHERSIGCGYAGNAGSGAGSRRSAILAALLEKRLISLRIRSNLPFTYELYCEYLTSCRMSLNIAYSGTEAVMQVKGRVLESALAGACLLENKGAPTKDWFEAGVDYLEYENAGDAARLIRLMADKPDLTEAMAFSLRKKVMERHSPAKFWGAILERIGIPPATGSKLRQAA